MFATGTPALHPPVPSGGHKRSHGTDEERYIDDASTWPKHFLQIEYAMSCNADCDSRSGRPPERLETAFPNSASPASQETVLPRAVGKD